MSQFNVSISDPATEHAFIDFAKNHNIDVSKIEISPNNYNPDIYDKNGNFQYISLTTPGLPVPKEYIIWRCEQAKKQILEGNGMSWDEGVKTLQDKGSKFFSGK